MSEAQTLAHRDEYLQDRVEKAAKLLWLVVMQPPPADDPHGPSLGPDRGWMAVEMVNMRLVLANDGPRYEDRCESWRWRILCVLNAPKAFKGSSARVESA